MSLESALGITDTDPNSLYGSGILGGIRDGIGTAANVLTAIQAARNGSQVQANGVPVNAPAQTAPQGFFAKLPKWAIPAALGVVILAAAAFFFLRRK